MNSSSPQNKFLVKIENGSADSKDSASNLHKMPKKPTLTIGMNEKATGAIYMQDNAAGIIRRTYDKSKEFNSMGSSQRSFDVQPKYTTRPRVTIEAAALNRDIEEGNSGGHRLKKFLFSFLMLHSN